jgi:hypothetical protein
LDEHDQEFLKMKEESEKNRFTKMVDELEKYKNQVEECKRSLVEKKKQVEHWKMKVDKSCVERIRAFQNPPALIGQIIEIVIVLIGRKRFNAETAANSTPRLDGGASTSQYTVAQKEDRQSQVSDKNRPSNLKKNLLVLPLFVIKNFVKIRNNTTLN